MDRLVSYIKGVLATLVLVVNVLSHFTLLLLPLAVLKLLLPFKPIRRVIDYLLGKVAESWVGINNAWMWAVQPHPWEVTGQLDFKTRGWYLVGCNHQSWVDILVLQRVFNRRIPLLKFFLKYELIYVPLMGFAWWALDFPFMRRKGGASMAKDLATARKSCEKFKLIPTSVISFQEGTRFNAQKQQQQRSPYKYLLKPKVGGLAMALETMGPLFDAMIDVTIVYPGGVPSFGDLLMGRVKDVLVQVREVPIPPEYCSPEAMTDPQYRAKLQVWINEVWQQKDQDISTMGERFAARQLAARS